MDRVKKLKLNAISSMVNRIVILISGLILPRLILVYYGSDINGLVASIGQFLSIIMFLDLGVGSVVQSALYKPLALNDEDQISRIIKSAANFFKKIAYALIIYLIFLVAFFPTIIQSNVNYLATALLIIAMSINHFAQYYFGIVNELLLNADQKAYIQLNSEIVTVSINIVVTVLLITNGFSIVTVKLATALIYLIRPVYLKLYVDKNYNIDTSIKITEEPIKQKWNGITQHAATLVMTSSDTVILSFFSTLETVSIYAVYSMVVGGIRLLITSVVTSIKSFLGDLLANNENDQLNSYFNQIEWLIHTSIVFLFGMTAVLITPFVAIYTSGVNDVNYHMPLFGVLLTISQALYCIRLPYNTLILAAGHFRQTQTSAIIEATINIIVSIISVMYFGIIGVALGTIFAMAYRTIYFAIYLSRNILFRSLKVFMKQILVDLAVISLYFVSAQFINVQYDNIIQWILSAIFIGSIYVGISFIINIFFYKDKTLHFIKKITRRI